MVPSRVSRTEFRLQGLPRSTEGTEDPTAWPGSWELPSASSRRLGANLESGSEPAGGAASAPRGARDRAAPDPRARPGAGFSSRGISLSAQQDRLVGLHLEALAFYLPGSVQQLPRSSWASRPRPIVFKPQHRGHRHRQPYGTPPGLRAVAPRAAPSSASVRPTSHVGLPLSLDLTPLSQHLSATLPLAHGL